MEDDDPCNGWIHCAPDCCGPCPECGGYADNHAGLKEVSELSCPECDASTKVGSVHDPDCERGQLVARLDDMMGKLPK
mgnify:CR=1 FL=1